MQKNIGVIGLWHLGCVLTASWYKLGNRVMGFDYDKERVLKLNQGIPPLYEPELQETIQQGLTNKRIQFSEDIKSLADCDFIFLSYDTPVRDDDSSDTSILEKSIQDVSKVMRSGSVLIVSSQSPAGFCRKMREILKKANNNLDIAYSPENLRLGEAIACYLNPGRIILGTADPSTESKCKALFSLINAEVISMNLESAEMVKHGINAFLSTSIVFSNHLADLCEMTGAKIQDVIQGLKTDPRIGQKAYLSPGIGFSGGTLGRDLQVLDQTNHEHAGYSTLFGLVHKLNSERKLAIVNKIVKLAEGSKDKTVGILGLTYKPGTSTLRRSRPLEIVDLLISKGFKVKVYDPKADYNELTEKPFLFTIASNIEEVAISTDVLILLTEWPEFKDYQWQNIPSKMKNRIFYDTKNFLNEKEMKEFGFQYHSVGH